MSPTGVLAHSTIFLILCLSGASSVHKDLREAKFYKQGLEGYFRDPGFDQNTVRDSGKRKIF